MTRITSPIVQLLADAAAGKIYSGLTLLTAPFTPTGSGFTLFSFSWDGRSSISDLVNFYLFVLDGGTPSGGTVIDGIRYRSGASPDISIANEGNVVTVPAYGTTPVPGPGLGAPSQNMTGAAQLVVGTPYLLHVEAYGTNTTAAHLGQLVTFYAAEL